MDFFLPEIDECSITSGERMEIQVTFYVLDKYNLDLV